MSPRKQVRQSSLIRIIAGRWKGRRITIVADGIRPTGDRVRETLFNWLMPHIHNARCLDLFAGTGALGIEALSRGAGSVVFAERNRPAAKAIRNMLKDLAGDEEYARTKIITIDALKLDLGAKGPFDIVFLDPPFDGPHLQDLCTLLEQSNALAPSAHIYMEMDRRQDLPELPTTWAVSKEQTAGQVRYALVSCGNEISVQE
ncbi:MAG: 16S rRNA (guanine(966)-N(2))-methyltransferase RsmD [Gammaproteobacteria bacterium]|nr:MAG: 16S rRNA (guanine(966)-N(2))-methyltransferase RsmD [Gammaproteobacteria bacterium]